MKQKSNLIMRCSNCKIILSEDIDDIKNKICDDCKKEKQMEKLMGNKVPKQFHKVSRPKKYRNNE